METSLRKSFAIQRRVIGALLMREVITRYGRHNIGFLWLFVEPMIFTLGVMGLWQLIGVGHGHGISATAFAVTGYSSVLLWRNIATRCTTAIEPNLSLMHHRNVRVLDLFAARALLEICGASMSFIVLSASFSFANLMEPPADFLRVIFGWVLLAWFGSALGLLMGSLSEQNPVVEKLWHPATYLLFPLSGAAFMVDWLPPVLQKIVLNLPMVHCVEILRSGFSTPNGKFHFNVPFVVVSCLLVTLMGLAQSKIVARNIALE